MSPLTAENDGRCGSHDPEKWSIDWVCFWQWCWHFDLFISFRCFGSKLKIWKNMAESARENWVTIIWQLRNDTHEKKIYTTHRTWIFFFCKSSANCFHTQVAGRSSERNIFFDVFCFNVDVEWAKERQTSDELKRKYWMWWRNKRVSVSGTLSWWTHRTQLNIS